MSVMPPRDRVPTAPLDDVSKAIIEQLQQDGRRPYAAIGKAVGLSEVMDLAVMEQALTLTGSPRAHRPARARPAPRCSG